MKLVVKFVLKSRHRRKGTHQLGLLHKASTVREIRVYFEFLAGFFWSMSGNSSTFLVG
jgi:hypothetical protein